MLIEDCSAEDNSVSTESCYCCSCGSQSTNWKHMMNNTPASSNYASSSRQKHTFQRLCHSEQINTMDKFQSMVSVMSSLKKSLSTLTREAFVGTRSMLSQKCTHCNGTRHAIKLCTSCLATMNSECAQSMELLRNVVAHFVRYSTNGICKKENEQFSEFVKNIEHILTETLPKVLGIPQLNEFFSKLAKKIANADMSCNTCDYEFKSVMIIVQQLLLLLSIRNNYEEYSDLIAYLVNCLLEMRFTCDGESEYVHSDTDDNCNTSVPENLSYSSSVSIRIEGESFRSESPIRNNSEIESNGTCSSSESNLNISQLTGTVKNDYLKLVNIKSLSGLNSCASVDAFYESNAHSAASLTENIATSFKESGLKSSLISIVSEPNHCNEKKIHKGKNTKLSKIWRSLDSFIRPRRPATVQNITQNRCNPTPDQCKTTNTIEVDHAIASTSFKSQKNHFSPVHSILHNRESIFISKDNSITHSSRCSTENGSSLRITKTRTEMMKVELTNKGDGFGLGIDFRDNSSSSVPVINYIEPKSPSHKIGILKLGDRILGINRKSTANLTSQQLLILKKSSFCANTIILKVEFDVVDEEYKFGTFDVGLDRTLKIGLIFEDMKKGSPMVLSGIVKGGAAHRCGQLFPGDKLSFFRLIRNEKFDPIACKYDREENVFITVQREPRQVSGVPDKSFDSFPSYASSRFYQEDSVPRKGSNFVVKSATIHQKGGTNDLFLDHEVTLFRDSSTFDFGILLGEHRDTGHSYITDIRPDGPAYKSGVIKKFDRILEVNGVLVDKNVKNSALDLISRADDKVDLLIRRIYHENLNGI